MTWRRWFPRCFAVLAAAACAKPLPPVPAIALAPADATLDAEFSHAGSMRELRDGRVLIADEQENRLLVTDTAFRTAMPIGHRGEGPGEYRAVSQLWPIGGDSTLMTDGQMRRWTLIDGVVPVATVPPDAPASKAFYLGMITGSNGGDTLIGRVAAMHPGSSLSDSLLLIRVARSSGHADTLGKLFSGEPSGDGQAAAPAGPPGAPRKKIYMVALVSAEGGVAFPDGWIAIPRAAPYRIDWCSPRGKCERGPQLEPPRAMSMREKQAYLAFAAKTSKWPPTNDVSETLGWPQWMPAFVIPSTQFASEPWWPLPDGRVLLERLPTADALLWRYDVLTRQGTIAGRFSLSLNQRIIGVGAHALYLATANDDGLEQLTRHPWP